MISNEQMQTLWARVLAGEINHPGTFSRRTVNAIADLDQRDCAAFTSLCRFCWRILDDNVPLIFDQVDDPIYTNHGVNFDSVQHLDSIGLISFQGPGGQFSRRTDPQGEVAYFGERFTLELPAGADGKLVVGRVKLTAIGEELERVSGAEPVPGFKDFVLLRWGKLLKPFSTP